ncbi:DsrE/DsrF/DrsH-like family protein [[Clostridium] fimetarium]|uniref:NADPH-dependent 2,4-dienoyl-CoA reductase, sulfur reductase n=1 Tax=[Clostridium] fimetarium TaxID=99656 RepID=A0A1I0RJU2_9FIRM|nr:DsrE/DsrF/DrsH-like family protein [[Clostridium] fimetarium]SEW41309.1 NADPH-dependent 2,4-dienoyl-CoA reductase, sulfur reductase [[Clostridium] fimetarium]
MRSKTVIIGGVAGGATTAARLRRRDESMEIIMFEKGEYISYANCGLPYYIGDVIKSRDALLLQTPMAMKNKFNIDVRIASEVTAIHVNDKKVSVKNLKTGEEYEETYDFLVIATGSSPIKPPIPGIDGDNIFTLWTVPDTDVIKAYINEKKPKTAAVIGGGFIGLEMAENLHTAGLEVSLIEMQNQVMAPVDYEMAQLLHENMRMNHINLVLEDGVRSFDLNNGKTIINLSSGKIIEADMVILSIGVRPNSTLAKNAGIALNEKGGIIVHDCLQTSEPNIYAVGDVIEVENFVLKDKTMVPLAGPANKQARICADNIVGGSKKYKGTLGTAVAKVFDLNVASVGMNEKALKVLGKEKGRDYDTVVINQKSHAGYYPGATPITLKLIFDKVGKIYGGQIIGQDGVDKRIDTIATTMRLNGTIYDLAELELAYAPPFSSAKDPVNMLGFVAENVIDGLVSFIESDELDKQLQSANEDYIVLDVTEEMERMVFSIPDSYHIPLGQIHERLNELDREKLIIIYCAIGVRSYNAARVLMQNGFQKVKVLSGGTAFYKSMHHMDEIETRPVLKPQSGNGEKMSEEEKTDIIKTNQEIKVLDCCGLQCPGPIMKVYEAICAMEENQILKVSATDMGFAKDIDSWCKRTGNTLIKTERKDKENIVYIKKGVDVCDVSAASTSTVKTQLPQGKTLVVFSGDLDKVLAAFIIANGAASMGRPVTMFFTFWGLNALRKQEKVSVKKPIIDRMFGAMMPRGAKKLKLSNLNMGGMGTLMMRKVMKDKNVDSIEELMKKAMASGIKLVACTMSMDVMGITKDELIEGVELAGVASYLGDAEESNVNLFI